MLPCIRSRNVLVLMGLLGLLGGALAQKYVTSSEPPPEKDAAIARVEELKGSVSIDGDAPGQPVWRVDFSDVHVTAAAPCVVSVSVLFRRSVQHVLGHTCETVQLLAPRRGNVPAWKMATGHTEHPAGQYVPGRCVHLGRNSHRGDALCLAGDRQRFRRLGARSGEKPPGVQQRLNATLRPEFLPPLLPTSCRQGRSP